VVFPVVVVEGRVFEARLGTDGMIGDEVGSARVHWRGAERHRFAHATFDVVTAEYVEEFARPPRARYANCSR